MQASHPCSLDPHRRAGRSRRLPPGSVGKLAHVCAVLLIGRSHLQRQHTAQNAHRHVHLAAMAPFMAIAASLPPLSTEDRNVRPSMMTAVDWAALPFTSWESSRRS